MCFQAFLGYAHPDIPKILNPQIGGQMAHYGTLRDTLVGEANEDIRGSHLYGLNDEKLGKIDDVIFDHSTGDIHYAVVDTGGWLHSKKFLVPANALRASAKHEND